MFTGDEFRDGLLTIEQILNKEGIKGAFFITGKFLEDQKVHKTIKRLARMGHAIGPHSDQHLLYAPWDNRDSLLVTKEEFVKDLMQNENKLRKLGVTNFNQFIPPYEWYNQLIVDWAKEMGYHVYNFTPGLRTAADYTFPEMNHKYLSSAKIVDQVLDYEAVQGLNGYIILIHIGTDPRRPDKFYYQLGDLIKELKSKKYKFVPLENI